MAVAPEMETWDTSQAREEDEHNEKSCHGDEGNLVLDETCEGSKSRFNEAPSRARLSI